MNFAAVNLPKITKEVENISNSRLFGFSSKVLSKSFINDPLLSIANTNEEKKPIFEKKTHKKTRSSLFENYDEKIEENLILEEKEQIKDEKIYFVNKRKFKVNENLIRNDVKIRNNKIQTIDEIISFLKEKEKENIKKFIQNLNENYILAKDFHNNIIKEFDEMNELNRIILNNFQILSNYNYIKIREEFVEKLNKILSFTDCYCADLTLKKNKKAKKFAKNNLNIFKKEKNNYYQKNPNLFKKNLPRFISANQKSCLPFI